MSFSILNALPPKPSLANVLKEFEVEWEHQPISIEKAIQRLQNGEYPQLLMIFHPSYGTAIYNLWNNYYSIGQSGPAATRWGLARTAANQIVDKEYILHSIDGIFDNISEKLGARNRGRQKLLRDQLFAARRMMNRSGQNVPRNIEQSIYEAIGEKKPVQSSFNVPNSIAKIQSNLFTNEVNMPRHLKKINTTLFNGGKRKSKKSRQTRRKYHK